MFEELKEIAEEMKNLAKDYKIDYNNIPPRMLEIYSEELFRIIEKYEMYNYEIMKG
jgi:hypothetical protein